MQFIHPSIKLETSNRTIQEFMDIIEKAGRTCWKSETNQYKQALKYIRDLDWNPQGYEIMRAANGGQPLTLEQLMSPDFVRSARDDEAFRQVTRDFNRRMVKIGHTSVLEHSAITVRILTDRAVTHQLVRHRIAAYSQESQRYVGNDGHVMFIIPEGSGLEPGYYSFDQQSEREVEVLSKILCTPENPHTEFDTVDIKEWPRVGMPFTWVSAMQHAENAYLDLRSAGVKKQDARSVLPNATKTEIVATYNIPMWRHVMKERLDPAAQHDIRKIMGMILDKFLETPMAILFEDLKNVR